MQCLHSLSGFLFVDDADVVAAHHVTDICRVDAVSHTIGATLAIAIVGQVRGLLDAIAKAAEVDDVISTGQALSEREEAVLQALEIMTRDTSHADWIRAQSLREQVAQLMGLALDQLGHAQWIGHILKRLHLTDDGNRKRRADGMAYRIDPADVRDMMRRYHVSVIDEQQAR